MRVILDTNIWISMLLGKKSKVMKQMLSSDLLIIYVCRELLTEICDVCSRDKIKKYIREGDLDNTIALIKLFCEDVELSAPAKSNVRDPKDLYLLTLAEQVDAKLIVTGDNDLLVLQNHKNTNIIKWSDFMVMMEELGIIDDK